LHSEPPITSSNAQHIEIPVEDVGRRYLHDPTEHLKTRFRDQDDVDWSGIAMEPTETRWIQD